MLRQKQNLIDIFLTLKLHIQVHACDVVEKMVEEDVKNVNDFEWISQLR